MCSAVRLTKTSRLVDQPSDYLTSAHVLRESPRLPRVRREFAGPRIFIKKTGMTLLSFDSDTDSPRFVRCRVCGGRNFAYEQTYPFCSQKVVAALKGSTVPVSVGAYYYPYLP